MKHLQHHDGGRTLATILRGLEKLGYMVSWRVLNASQFGVPQNRERVIIVGALNETFSFDRLCACGDQVYLRDFLDTEGPFEYLTEPYTLLEHTTRRKSGLIFSGYHNKRIRGVGIRPGTEHLSRVHKQPNRIYSTDGVHPALPSQESSGRFWILHQGRVRKLTISECYRIMGFPSSYRRVCSLGEQYRQIGNSVCVPMIEAVAGEVVRQGFV